jgi:hypothetical protein
MERVVDEIGKGRIAAALRTGEKVEETSDMGTFEGDSCIAGPRTPTTSDMDHRGILSDVEVPELFEALDEIEQFVRRNPWPMLALGFAAGYWLSRSRGR